MLYFKATNIPNIQKGYCYHEENHVWLTSLTDSLSEEFVENLVSHTRTLSEKDDVENADSVLQVVMTKNQSVFDYIREEQKEMCEALREFFKPEIDAIIASKDAEIEAIIVSKDETIAEKDEALAEKDRIIEELQKKLNLNYSPNNS